MDTQKPFTGMLAVKKYFEDGACKVQAKEFNEFWKVCTAADKIDSDGFVIAIEQGD